MPKIEFNSSVSFGNLLTILAFMGALAVAWGEKTNDVDSLIKSDAMHDAALRSTDTAVRTLEKSHERILERLDGIKSTMEKMEKKLP